MVSYSCYELLCRDEREVDKIMQSDSVKNQVEISACGGSESLNVQSNKEGKLYRCMHCDMTDTNAYLLLLHQIKSHPGEMILLSWHIIVGMWCFTLSSSTSSLWQENY